MSEPTTMKMMFGIGSLAILFCGCQKEIAIPQNPSSDAPIQAKAHNLRQYYQNDEFGVAYCFGYNGNCLPDVVVTRLHEPAMDAVFIALRSGDQSAIVHAFIDHREVLLKYMEKQDIDFIIDGTYRGGFASGENNSSFILARSSDGTVISAYPFFPE